jgi:hypothetical protein
VVTKADLQEKLLATNEYMKAKMWNAATGNFIRSTNMPLGVQGSDSWGITIVLDAYAYLVELGYMKPPELKQYFASSTALYQRTDNGHGARLLRENPPYIGGDDDLQWCSALVHCYAATKDVEYLNEARSVFNAMIALGFWKNPDGWAWNSNDQRPNGVSTAYGALAAARLYQATGEQVFKQWADVSLNALHYPQVGYFPRDRMVAVQAMLALYEASKEARYLNDAQANADKAVDEANQVIAGKKQGQLNPTDIGDLAEGLYQFSEVDPKPKHHIDEGDRILDFFLKLRSAADIKQHGFYSLYDSKGEPVMQGASYIGVPLDAQFLPEVAEMLKLEAAALKHHQ